MFPKQDIIDAFNSAYDEVRELETFPIEQYNISTDYSYHTLTLIINNGDANKIELDFDRSDDVSITITLTRRSLIEIDDLNIILIRRSIRTIENKAMSYSELRDQILSMLTDIVDMQSNESSEVIKSVSIRIFNLYEKGITTKKHSYIVNDYKHGIKIIGGIYSDIIEDSRVFFVKFWTKTGIKVERIKNNIIQKTFKEVSPDSLAEYAEANDY
jgi:hypothetical protein